MSKCRVFTFYNHGSGPVPQWSQYQNPREEERRLKDLGKSFAIIRRVSRVNGAWVASAIEVQCPLIRTALDVVFKDYPDWYLDASPYVFTPPFAPFVHRWYEFNLYCDTVRQRAPASDILKHLLLLRDELKGRITNDLATLKLVEETRAVSFNNIWLVLAPGRLMLSERGGKPEVFKLVQAVFRPGSHGEEDQYVLTLAAVDWNGRSTAVRIVAQGIKKYENTISVGKLPVVPADLSKGWDKLRPLVLSRGRRFEALRGFHLKAYTGSKYSWRLAPTGTRMVEMASPVCWFPNLFLLLHSFFFPLFFLLFSPSHHVSCLSCANYRTTR